jgi:serine/threonine protein kinase
MSDPAATGDWQPPEGAGPVAWPTVAGYEVVAEIGRGAMGVVYKARQVAADRMVALKVIRDGSLASPQARARFRIEAAAVGRVRHPNIVEILETGEHEGLPFFSMELVEGDSLDRHAAGRPLPPARAAELVRTIALAVQHAHDNHIVHRDLKPANILLSAELGARNSELKTTERQPPPSSNSAFRAPSSALGPKVTDFGLAKLLDSDEIGLTQAGAVLGTASYMAPEQAAGRVDEIGPAVDVYALGAILYELLTGRAPFVGESWNQTLQHVLNDEPPLPTLLHAGVPRDLEAVTLKCLEKDPARRYASARELADDLGRFLESKPVAAAPPDPAERLGRLAARDGYQIVGVVGRGPRATVYRALHGPLKQPVALKVFARGSCTREEWDARLKRSAELWAGLAHPHIVAVQRAGWWDDSPHLTEEYVAHGTLAAQLGGRPLPVREALRTLEQLAEVVAFVHRQGRSHGNLKPNNVLLAADGIPRVVDFRPPVGLAHHPHPADCDPAALAYVAPEFLDAPHAEPRPHTDVYGLGLILYEMLTGRPPLLAATTAEMLEELRRREPERPSRFNRAVTPALDKFCLRCLAKNPWRRGLRAYDVLKFARSIQEGA